MKQLGTLLLGAEVQAVWTIVASVMGFRSSVLLTGRHEEIVQLLQGTMLSLFGEWPAMVRSLGRYGSSGRTLLLTRPALTRQSVLGVARV